jgi:hypothetical protein
MAFSRTGLVAISLMALAASGCQSSRMSSLDTQQPAPLEAAPAGTVTGGALPPPAAPGTATSQFPAAPGAGEQVAGLPPADAAPPAGAPDLSSGAVTGVWKASVSGQSCQIATSLTKLGANNRAAPLRCAAPIDGVKSWNVAGKQLTLYDETGNTVARLYSSGTEKFDGQTESGVPISLTR